MRKPLALGLGTVASLLICQGPAAGATVDVGTGSSNVFAPSEVATDVGSTVTITNSGGGQAPHNAIWEDGSPGMPTASTTRWTTSRTFTAAGDYRFYCSVHGGPGGVGMSGIVHVTPAAAPPAPLPQPQAPPAATPPVPAPAPSEHPPPPGTPVAGASPNVAAVATGTRRGVVVQLTLDTPARVVIQLRRGGRTVARRVFARRPAGTSTLRLRASLRRGRVTVRVIAVGAGGKRVVKVVPVTVR